MWKFVVSRAARAGLCVLPLLAPACTDEASDVQWTPTAQGEGSILVRNFLPGFATNYPTEDPHTAYLTVSNQRGTRLMSVKPQSMSRIEGTLVRGPAAWQVPRVSRQGNQVTIDVVGPPEANISTNRQLREEEAQEIIDPFRAGM